MFPKRHRIGICSAIVLVVWVFSAPAYAICDAPPESAIVPIDALIDRSSRIVLARVDESGQGVESVSSGDVRLLDREKEIEKVRESSPQPNDRLVADVSIVSLTVVEELKGSGDDQIHLPGTDLMSKYAQDDFLAHQQEVFWRDETVGRVGFDDNCRILANFAGGNLYLVMLGPTHVKSYELIKDDNDRWLAYVRQRVANPGK